MLLAARRSRSRLTITVREFSSVITALITARDQMGGYPSMAITLLTKQLCDALHVDNDTRQAVLAASRIYDIGILGLSDQARYGAGPLDDITRLYMEAHAALGADVLRHVAALRPLEPIVRAHHEHWDGGGYPCGLAGEAIPLGARIIAVVDAYQAMVSDRPYRCALSPSEALDELERKAGSQFDPTVVAAFRQRQRAVLAQAPMVLDADSDAARNWLDSGQ